MEVLRLIPRSIEHLTENPNPSLGNLPSSCSPGKPKIGFTAVPLDCLTELEGKDLLMKTPYTLCTVRERSKLELT